MKIRSKITSCLVLLLVISLIIPGTILGASPASTEVDIPDAELQRIIRETLELDYSSPITVEDMEALEWLHYYGNYFEREYIEDLNGLRYAVNLTTFEISGKGYLDNIEELSFLTELTHLY